MVARHLNFGAILKAAGNYECIRDAKKEDLYMCPVCCNDVIVKQGSVKRKHFAHKAKCSCEYYTKPSESQQHKESKLLFKSLLESRRRICISKRCGCQSEIQFPDQFRVVVEHQFKHLGRDRRADVAILDQNGKIINIVEIYHTHNIEEGDRPEPWCEVSAVALLTADLSCEVLNLKCNRRGSCMECERKLMEEKMELERKRQLRIQQRQQEELEANLEWERMQETIRQHAKFMEQRATTTPSHIVTTA